MHAIWLSAWVLAMLAQQPVLSANAVRQIAALEADKAARTPAQRKIASSLLYAAKMRRGEAVALGVPSLRLDVDIDGRGAVLVDLRADVSDALIRGIEAAGGTIVSRVDTYGSVRTRIPIDAIERIAGRPEVRFVRPADIAATNQINTSQGDVAHRAALERSTFGFDGTGVGVGVLSDGVTSLATAQGTGDLPPSVTVLPGQAGSGNEGTAMLEIVHDLAPGAKLYFATAFNGQASFAANIEALCDAGANIIVDDVFYYAEAAFQDGIIARGVLAAMGKGCYYFSSAGNSGNLDDGTSGTWEGDFVASGASLTGAVGTIHSFGGSAISDQITGDPRGWITLKWSDPMGASANDYDLYLFDSGLNSIITASTDPQTGLQDPIELVSSYNRSDVNSRLVIVRYSGAGRFLQLDTHGGRLGLATGGEIAGHAAVDGAYAVAAVNVATAGGGTFTGGAANPVETFSSDGPSRVFYQPDGTPITPGNFSSTGGTVRQKPDVAAADGVATSMPGFNPFFGTSAAAPHAAAIAALVLDAAGSGASLAPAVLRGYLTSTALDIEASGVDRDSGAGILDAYTAVLHTHVFTDDPLVVGVTPVRAVHLWELRARIDSLRVRFGLSAYAWAESIAIGVTPIRAAHVIEMRTALNSAYTAAARALPTYTDPGLAAGAAIKAVHISELRAAVVALEGP